jgi:hypothetical protein
MAPVGGAALFLAARHHLGGLFGRVSGAKAGRSYKTR